VHLGTGEERRRMGLHPRDTKGSTHEESQSKWV